MTEGTLVFLFRGTDILLAMKKRGHGEGKWNGPGGKLLPGEAALDGALREVREEVGVLPTLRRELGLITYHEPSGESWRVHVFRCSSWKGEPVESEEMRPQWWPTKNIPYQQMWSGDAEWLPYVIRDHPFVADIWSDGQGGVTKIELKDK